MAEVINMPRLSDTMEEGTVAKWLKKVGDKVEEGDILAEIETDKATMEFESFHEGTLLHIGIEEGDGAPVDSLLAIIGNEGEDISALLNGGGNTDTPIVEVSKPTEETQEEINTPTASAPTEIPDGVEIVNMPRLSDTMEEGTVAAWLKKVGDTVEEGDILAEIETDKATMEFESFYSGTLLHIGIQEGEGAPVDSLLAIIGPAGTDVSAVLNAPAGTDTSAIAEETTAVEPKGEEEKAGETISAADGQRIFASPLAKKIAEDKGISLNEVKGSGDNGRIVKRDVENYQAAPTSVPVPTVEPAEQQVESPTAPIRLAVGEESIEEVKNSTMRKVIAKRLGESKFSAPHYYLTIEVDMDNAKASRAQINSLPDTKVSFNDMVLKACAMALKKHP
ncbi:MAG: biotin/lipoyl-containing protein, partial [Bacteroidota bacterium]